MRKKELRGYWQIQLLAQNLLIFFFGSKMSSQRILDKPATGSINLCKKDLVSPFLSFLYMIKLGKTNLFAGLMQDHEVMRGKDV